MKLNPKKFTIINEKIQTLLNDGVNPFSYYINNKKKHNIKWYFECRDFVKYLNTVSPSWKLLWCIADFIHMAEMVYMYHNMEDAPIYSFLITKSTVRSFRVNHKDFYIEYTLYEEDHFINIKVCRAWNEKSISQISFPDGGAIMETRVDEILMFNIIEWTMEPIRKVFEECYKTAKEVKK